MSSSRRTTIAGALDAYGLPLVFGGLAVVAVVAIVLGAGVLFDREGEAAFPVVVAEYFWIAVWLFASALVALAVVWIAFRLLARRFARSIVSLAETAERAAVSHERMTLDERQGIDELHRLAVSFNRLLSERDRKSEELRNVSRNALHDLRAPLSRICDAADHLEHGLATSAEAAAAIHRSGRALMRLIELSAEISKNYSGCEGVPPVELDIAALAKDMADIYTAAAEDREISLTCSLPQSPVMFSGHESKLRRMIGNLLDNAIKFTQDGGQIRLTLTAAADGVRLEISDTGCGIADDERDLVFERFYRGKGARQIPGTGLGLSLVHSIVMFYHGEIVCDSRLGRGTAFRVFLPQ